MTHFVETENDYLVKDRAKVLSDTSPLVVEALSIGYRWDTYEPGQLWLNTDENWNGGTNLADYLEERIKRQFGIPEREIVKSGRIQGRVRVTIEFLP